MEEDAYGGEREREMRLQRGFKRQENKLLQTARVLKPQPLNGYSERLR